MNKFCMFKRGLILIGILILLFNFNIPDVSPIQGFCVGCIDDEGCGEGYACRINDGCIDDGWDGLQNLDYECSTESEAGNNGVVIFHNCNPVRSAMECQLIGQGYRDERCERIQPCENAVSCEGDTLRIQSQIPQCPDDDGTYRCQQFEDLYEIDCTTVNDKCSELEDIYGESCYCESDGIRGGCREPTNFIPVMSSSGNCGDGSQLYDGYGDSLGVRYYEGEWINVWDPVFFYDGRLFYEDLGNHWICNEDEPKYTILDLENEYDIYAIRVYGGPVDFKLSTSLNQNDWSLNYEGNIGDEPNYENRGVERNEEYEEEYDVYFLIRVNPNNCRDEEGEACLDSPLRTRYIKYEVTSGYGDNFGHEIVIEGILAGDIGPVCGNGNIEAGEECDGISLNDQTCLDLSIGYNKGVLRCNSPDVGNSCNFDTSGCYYEPDEVDLYLSISDSRTIIGDDGRVIRNMCPDNSEEITLTLTNNGENVYDVYIYDTVFYDQDCDGVGNRYLDYNNRFSCGDIAYRDSCIRNYDLRYYFPGCYYHNAYVSSGVVEELNR